MDRTRVVFKALGEELRFRIYRILLISQKSLAVCELVDVLMKPQYAVSRALSGLKQARLVAENSVGKMTFYSPSNLEGHANLKEFILGSDDSTGSLETDMDRLKWRLDIRVEDRCIITYPASRTFLPEKDQELPKKVLFLGKKDHGSQKMAAEYLQQLGKGRFVSDSADLEPEPLNPFVVQALEEEGIKVEDSAVKNVFDLYFSGNNYDLIISSPDLLEDSTLPSFPRPVKLVPLDITRMDDSASLESVKEDAADIRKKVESLIHLN